MTAGRFLLGVLARLAAAVPATLDPSLARAGAAIVNPLLPERERNARRNLEILFPQRSGSEIRGLARESSRAYVRFLLDYLRTLHTDGSSLVASARFAIDPSVREEIRSRRGLVVCAAHVGNWEIGALSLRRLGLPVVIVAGRQYAAAWRSRVNEAKEAAGITVVGPGHSPRRLVRALREGAAVCLLVDGDVFERGRPAPLCGRLVRLPVGPARLAGRTGALLVGATCLRESAGDYLVSLRSLEAPEGPGEPEERARHRTVARWLETVLRTHPGNWCMFRDFFAGSGELAHRDAPGDEESASLDLVSETR